MPRASSAPASGTAAHVVRDGASSGDTRKGDGQHQRIALQDPSSLGGGRVIVDVCTQGAEQTFVPAFGALEIVAGVGGASNRLSATAAVYTPPTGTPPDTAGTNARGHQPGANYSRNAKCKERITRARGQIAGAVAASLGCSHAELASYCSDMGPTGAETPGAGPARWSDRVIAVVQMEDGRPAVCPDAFAHVITEDHPMMPIVLQEVRDDIRRNFGPDAVPADWCDLAAFMRFVCSTIVRRDSRRENCRKVRRNRRSTKRQQNKATSDELPARGRPPPALEPPAFSVLHAAQKPLETACAVVVDGMNVLRHEGTGAAGLCRMMAMYNGAATAGPAAQGHRTVRAIVFLTEWALSQSSSLRSMDRRGWVHVVADVARHADDAAIILYAARYAVPVVTNDMFTDHIRAARAEEVHRPHERVAHGRPAHVPLVDVLLVAKTAIRHSRGRPMVCASGPPTEAPPCCPWQEWAHGREELAARRREELGAKLVEEWVAARRWNHAW